MAAGSAMLPGPHACPHAGPHADVCLRVMSWRRFDRGLLNRVPCSGPAPIRARSCLECLFPPRGGGGWPRGGHSEVTESHSQDSAFHYYHLYVRHQADNLNNVLS